MSNELAEQEQVMSPNRGAAMTRKSGTAWRWIAWALPVAGLLGTTGCTVDGPQALLIVQTESPDTTTCAAPAKAGEARLVSSVYDVALDRLYPYRMYPVVTNQLASFVGSGKGGADEANNVSLTGFRVQIAPPPGVGAIPWAAGCPGEFDWDLETHLIPPAGTVGTIVEAIRYCHVPVLRAQFQNKVAGFDSDMSAEVILRVTLRAKGKHGTSDLESAPFSFPIHVCYGCLQTGYSQPGYAQYNFPNVPACEVLTTNPFPGNLCDPAQDARILCCKDKTSGIICPAVPNPTSTSTTTSP
jgi:hypothetical protein